MRSFEERKKEIFCRSDEIIRKNKIRRKKIIYTGLPCLVITLTISSILVGQVSFIKKDAVSNDIYPSVNSSANFSTNDEKSAENIYNEPILKPDISDINSSSCVILYYKSTFERCSITNKQTVDSIISLVDGIVESNNTDTQTPSAEEWNTADKAPTSDHVLPEDKLETSDSVIITISKNSGEEVCYVYSNYVLENTETKEQYILTAEANSELKILIDKQRS